MTLSAETCLRGVLYTLQERVGPHVDDGFATEAARLSALVLSITANSIDDAVAVRVLENSAMRELFRTACEIVSAPDLADRLRQQANSIDPGLRISDLDGENDRLRLLLIQLHAYSETLNDARGHALSKKIWRMLADFERARAPRR